MKNHNVIMALVASTSLALLGSSTGCAVSPSDPETDADLGTIGETILVNEESQADLPGVELRIERRAGDSAFSLVEGSDWRVVAPGVWDLPSGDGTVQRVAAGEEGHRWLVEQAEAELDALHAQLDADEGAPELAQKIAAAEEKLATAQQSLQSAVAGPAPQAVSCNLALYTGPSSYVTSPPIAGSAALAQVVCSGGCATFTTSSQACCAGYCSGVSTATRTVCATPWTAGTVVSGYGSGYAWVDLSPAGISQSSSSFSCQ